MFGIFRHYPLFIVWTPGQPIGLVIFSGFWDDDVIESSEKQRPLRLSLRECLFRGEVLEIGVIRKYPCGVHVALYVKVGWP